MELVGTPPQQQQPAGRKRLPHRERPAAEDDALNQIAREAEARLAAKRAARAEAREIRMKELERQQKEIYQVQKKYCGLDAKFGDIEQWMEDTERYNRKSRRYTSVSDEDERMSVGSRGSLRPSEYSYYLGSGSRASSRASSARASPVVEERPDKDFERGVRTVSSLSAATLASLGGTSSRRGSGDTSISVDTEASIREIKDISELKDQIQDVEGKYMQGLKELKDSLAEVEEKYKKAMVSNAQLDNEKTNFMYQVDALKDALLELEEQLAESRRQYEEKNKDFEREKHAHSILQFQFMEVQEVLKQREELLAALERQKEFFDSIRSERDDLREEVAILKEQLKKHGIIPNTEVATNGETCERLSGSPSIVPVTSHTVQVAEDGTLGRAIEMEMKNESVENGRKREILQNTENEEHTEENEEMEIVQACLDTETLRTDGNVEAERTTGGHVVSALSLNCGLGEPASSHTVHVPRIACCFKNSALAESRDEWGLMGNVTEVKEAGDAKIEDGNVVNKIDKQNNVADPCVQVSLETNAVSEILSEEHNKDDQKESSDDESGTSDGEGFEETFDSVTGSPKATSSPSEPLKSADGAHTEAAKNESNVGEPHEAKKPRESKVVGSDLESQLAEGERGSKITNEAEWGKKGTDKTKEKNETENVFLPSAVERRETPSACESAQAESIAEEKQLEMQEPQPMSLQHDLLVEEEQKEQEARESAENAGKQHSEKPEQRVALLGTKDADSERNNEAHATKEILSGETVLDSASPSECKIHEERLLENDPKRHREMEPELISDGKTPACISAAQEEFTEGHEEDNPTQVLDEPTGEQSTEEQGEHLQEPAVITITEDTDAAAKGDQEDETPRKAEGIHNPSETTYEPTGEQSTEEQVERVQEPAEMTAPEKPEKTAEGDRESPRKAEEVHDIVPDIPESQKTDFRIQEEKPESEDEETGEEYHEAVDFGEFPSGELDISERHASQSSEEEKNKETEEKDRPTGGATQQVLPKRRDHDCEDGEQGAGDKSKEETDQSSVNEEMKESVLAEGDESIQEEKEEESEEAVPTGSSASESTKAPEHDTNGKLLVDNSAKETAECTLEQLENLGSSVDESPEEPQVSKKGKGKSREDCVVA
ncbi:leucine-rich repeat flightless-interacting protein 1 isoform X4 [Paroedura picta]|uniref:leucine-rich repeat flightless-interacting protein 1 isoform X4 n=1 Tax=Paroedura picta TaxID=143630 RepID=UPI004055C685